MTSDDRDVEPVTVYAAAERLDRAPTTLHVWAARYNARRLGKQGRFVYYDYADLAAIEALIRLGRKVPRTWQERAAPCRRDAEAA